MQKTKKELKQNRTLVVTEPKPCVPGGKPQGTVKKTITLDSEDACTHAEF